MLELKSIMMLIYIDVPSYLKTYICISYYLRSVWCCFQVICIRLQLLFSNFAMIEQVHNMKSVQMHSQISWLCAGNAVTIIQIKWYGVSQTKEVHKMLPCCIFNGSILHSSYNFITWIKFKLAFGCCKREPKLG